MSVTVARINVTPVKGLGLSHPDEVELSETGAPDNRRFYLIHDGRLFNGKDHGPLVAIAADYGKGRLTLRFPDGAELGGEIALGERVETDFWGRPVNGRVVEGPWAEALSDYAGAELLLVETERDGTGTDVTVGTLVGRASCVRLAEELGASVDPRRFRMLLELDGLAAHDEDEWGGRELRAGGAVIRVGGPVPRCAVTTHDPDSGLVTLDTLRGIRNYRGLNPSDGKSIDFGVYFDVERPGRVALGDAVTVL
jgi:uncharacterized protein YcbX